MADDTQMKKPNGFFRFFKAIYSVLKAYFIIVGMSVTLLPILIIVLVAKFGGVHSAPKVDMTQPVANGKPGIVSYKMDGPLLERSPDFSAMIIQQIFGGKSGVYLPDLRSSLRLVAENQNVKGLHLDLSMMSGGAAELAELRQILIEFKKSNKPIHVFTSDLDDSTLLVASAADHITMSPAGSVVLPGPMFQLMYFGDALKKLGVNIEVIRHGKYKSAFEPFILNDPSPESLEVYRSMEVDLRNGVIAAVAEGRKKKLDEVSGWYSKSLYTAKEAQAAGIVEDLSYLSESQKLLETTVEATGVIDLNDLESSSGKDSFGVSENSDDDGIALIEAIGDINMASAGGDDREGITPEAITKELKWASEAPNVKSVVMRVSSPGGSAVASDIIWREVKRLAETKPVVVSMGNVAASGGYYISAPASRILSEASTITGSIGVIGMLPKFTEFRAKYGVSFHVVTQSQRQALFSMGSSSTEMDKKLFGDSVDSMYQEFISKVAEGRSLKVDDVDKLAQGRVYTGAQALALGLVDEIGGLQDAFQAAKKLSGLDEKILYPILRYEPEKLTLAQCLRSPKDFSKCLKQSSKISMTAIARDTVSSGFPSKRISEVESKLAKVARLLESSHVLAYWPGAAVSEPAR